MTRRIGEVVNFPVDTMKAIHRIARLCVATLSDCGLKPYAASKRGSRPGNIAAPSDVAILRKRSGRKPFESATTIESRVRTDGVRC
jgi:hypothetical protein